MYDVIALGELLVDLAERTKDENGYPTLAANPGGAPGNFLAALSAYGKKTAFLAKVGDDTFGHLLTGTMRRAGIDTRGILISPDTFTTLAFVTFDAHGDRSFAFARKPGADTQLRWEEIDPAMLEQARVFHFRFTQLHGRACPHGHAEGRGLCPCARQTRHLRPQLPRPAVENGAGSEGTDSLGAFAGGYCQDQRRGDAVPLGLRPGRGRRARAGAGGEARHGHAGAEGLLA